MDITPIQELEPEKGASNITRPSSSLRHDTELVRHHILLPVAVRYGFCTRPVSSGTLAAHFAHLEVKVT